MDSGDAQVRSPLASGPNSSTGQPDGEADAALAAALLLVDEDVLGARGPNFV